MPPPLDERTTIVVDFEDLMDVAEGDPQGQRVELAIERLDLTELRELAQEAVRFGVWARPYVNMGNW